MDKDKLVAYIGEEVANMLLDAGFGLGSECEEMATRIVAFVIQELPIAAALRSHAQPK